MRIAYLHHSTGSIIWQGDKPSIIKRGIIKLSPEVAKLFGIQAKLPGLFSKYNKQNAKNYLIQEMVFPKKFPYGWNNYPYDYYNIWVKNAGEKPYMDEPTLELLTKMYDVIIFKHCYPVSNIKADAVSADINSDYRSLANYRLQYNAIKDKLHEFPDTKFILWTTPVKTQSKLTEEEALRTRDFYNWVKEEWDIKDDNIFLWDFYALETSGGLYLNEDFATSVTNSHPNYSLANKAANLLFNRIIDIIENNGKSTKLTGEKI